MKKLIFKSPVNIEEYATMEVNGYEEQELELSEVYNGENYIEEINKALKNFNEKLVKYKDCQEYADKGLMAFYDYKDNIKEKIKVLNLDFEVIDNKAYGVFKAEFYNEQQTLSNRELISLMDYVKGQASDGLGESFEQNPIKTKDGKEIYVSFNERLNEMECDYSNELIKNEIKEMNR